MGLYLYEIGESVYLPRLSINERAGPKMVRNWGEHQLIQNPGRTRLATAGLV